MAHQLVSENAADVGEHEVEVRVLDDAAVAHLEDVRQVLRVALTHAGDVWIQAGLEGAVTQPAVHFAEPFGVAWCVGGPVRNAEMFEIGLQAVFNDPCFSNEKDFWFNEVHEMDISQVSRGATVPPQTA